MSKKQEPDLSDVWSIEATDFESSWEGFFDYDISDKQKFYLHKSFQIIAPLFLGLLSAFLGGFQHRSFFNWIVPLGLIYSLLLVLVLSFLSRFISGRIGVILYAITFFIGTELLIFYNPYGKIFVTGSFGDLWIYPYLSYFFMYGGQILSLFPIIFPNKWFSLKNK